MKMSKSLKEQKKPWISHVSYHRDILAEEKEHLNYKLKNQKKTIKVLLKSNEALIIRNTELDKELTKLKNIIIQMKRKMKRIRAKVEDGVYTYGEYRIHACGSAYYNNRGYHIYKGEPLSTNYLATYSTLKDCEEYIDYDAR